MLTGDARHIQSRHDRTVQPGLPVVLGSFHAHSSEMPEDPELLALPEENRDHVGLRSNLSAEIDSCLLYTSPSPRDRQKSGVAACA